MSPAADDFVEAQPPPKKTRTSPFGSEASEEAAAKQPTPAPAPARSTYTGTMRQSAPYSAPRTTGQTSARPSTSSRPQTSSQPTRKEISPGDEPSKSWRDYVTPAEAVKQADLQEAAEQRRAAEAAAQAAQETQSKFRNRSTIRTITTKTLSDGTKQVTETSRPAPTSTFFAGYRKLGTEQPAKPKFDLAAALAREKAEESGQTQSGTAQVATTSTASTATKQRDVPANGTRQNASPQKPSTNATQDAPATREPKAAASTASAKRKAETDDTEEPPKKRSHDPSRIEAAKSRAPPAVTTVTTTTTKAKQREASKPSQQQTATPKPTTAHESSAPEFKGNQNDLGGDGGSRAKNSTITKPPKALPTPLAKDNIGASAAIKKSLAASPAKAVAKTDELNTSDVSKKSALQKDDKQKAPEAGLAEDKGVFAAGATDSDKWRRFSEDIEPSDELEKRDSLSPNTTTIDEKSSNKEKSPKERESSELSAIATSDDSITLSEPPKRKSSSLSNSTSSDDSTRPREKGIAMKVEKRTAIKRKPRSQEEKAAAAHARKVKSFLKI